MEIDPINWNPIIKDKSWHRAFIYIPKFQKNSTIIFKAFLKKSWYQQRDNFKGTKAKERVKTES